jgi:hypothetical protein
MLFLSFVFWFQLSIHFRLLPVSGNESRNFLQKLCLVKRGVHLPPNGVFTLPATWMDGNTSAQQSIPPKLGQSTYPQKKYYKDEAQKLIAERNNL